MHIDYLIVGSGLTGAVIARTLFDAGREVLVVDRRPHLGGNVHDHQHASGIRIHTYGPHYFRTSSERIWEFATRFDSFDRYEASLLSLVYGEYAQWPIGASYIKRHVGADWTPSFQGTPANFEEAALSLMPRMIYERFVKEYNEKQWGVPAHTLSASLCTRFDVREDDEPRLKPNARYQGIPARGYTFWTRSMLQGIPIRLDFDYLLHREEIRVRRHLVFTGPIDEFYGFDLGKLAYRGQIRDHVYHEQADVLLPCGQVNNPLHADGRHIRTLEWKHMMPAQSRSAVRGTVLTTETPYSPSNPSDYEYPFPDERNANLYASYRQRAASDERVTICGRLGEYRYFDMDQAIGRAMTIASNLLGQNDGCRSALVSG
jgi:UDP-galactopyranose mutase